MLVNRSVACIGSTLFAAMIFWRPTCVSAADDQFEYFETHIRPVLIEHCLECHRADADEIGGNLSLDSAAAIRTGGDSGPAIVAGDPDASPLIEAIRYDGLEMPPEGKLPDEIIKRFEKWVADGAADPRTGNSGPVRPPTGIDVEKGREFWAFRPVETVELPAGTEVSPVDRFLAAKRREVGINEPTIAASEVRLRRLAYDLTGLPPSPEDVKAFIAEPTDANWSAMVEKYLSSKEYGEHWGRRWLDVARYADTNGSDFNATYHDAWRYRDYIIDSYNNDRGFDELIVEQLAGDLLPYESPEDRTRNVVATTFLALGAKMLSERDKAKLALDIVDEQVDTVGKSFLGMTLGCARCHDHKFDPISTQDYYALAGIFRSTETVDGEIIQYVSDVIRMPLPVSPEVAAADAAYRVKKEQLENRIKATKKELDALRTSASLKGWLDLGIVVDNDKAELVGKWKESSYSSTRLGPDYVHNDMQEAAISATYRTAIKEPGEYEVRVSYSAASARANNVPVVIGTADGEVTVSVDQTKKPKYSDVLQPIGRFRFENEAVVTIKTDGTSGYVIADAVQFVPVDKADAAPPTATDDSELVAKKKALDAELEELQKNAPAPLPTALAVRDVEKPADCAIRIRGEPHREGASVPRGFIQVAMTSEPPELPAEQSGRLELSRWVASPDNPLTARVYVNRVWAGLFGEGIVRTPHNFGDLGERPTHPELLDWLAADFVKNGWSTKSLVRKIVHSQAYSASSQPDTVAAERDVENLYLSHANRRPLTAEQLRDSILIAAGQLDRGRTSDMMAGVGKLFSDSSGSGKSADLKVSNNVRTVYLPIVRNELPSMLTTFDFADPEMTVGKRSATNVPGQALFLMNDKFVHEMAQHIASQVGSDAEPIAAAYLRVMGRPASTETIERLMRFLDGSDDRDAGLIAVCHVLLASTEFRVIE